MRITDIDMLGYSLGGANAAMVKSIDAAEHKLNIHRAVMINPPVSLFSSVGRLDKLFAMTLGNGDAGVERFYQQLYAELANLYRASDRVELDEDFLLGAAAAVLKTDAEFSAAIALTFRIALVNMFFAGDLYAGTGVVVDPKHPPAGRRFARRDLPDSAQQAVLRIFHQGVRAVLSAAPAEFDRRLADRRQPARHHRRCAARRCRTTTRRPTATI